MSGDPLTIPGLDLLHLDRDDIEHGEGDRHRQETGHLEQGDEEERREQRHDDRATEDKTMEASIYLLVTPIPWQIGAAATCNFSQ